MEITEQPDELDDSVQDVLDAFAADAEDTEQVSVPTGPMGDDEHRDEDLPVRSIRAYEASDQRYGPIVVVEAELHTTPENYRSRNHQYTDTPQASLGEAVYQVMDRHGIHRPNTPEYGVKFGRPTGEPGELDDVMLVEGVIPLEGSPLADGGLIVGAPILIDTLAVYGIALPPLVGMARILTDLGEEYTIITNLDTETIDFGVYDDSTDAVADSDDLAGIATEPSDGNYARQSAAVSASSIGGNWGIDNDATISFDMTNTTGSVDSWFAEVNATLGGSLADHLVCTGALSQTYDLSNLTQLDISAGGVGWTVN